MSTPDEGFQFHGWVHENVAFYLAPIDDEQVGLYIQQDRTTELAGVFIDAAMAQMFMAWMDGSLTATAQANSELLDRLQHEQPLLFAPADLLAASDDDEEEADG